MSIPAAMSKLWSRLAHSRRDPVVARAAPFLLFIVLVMLASQLQSPWIVVMRAPVIALLLVWFWAGYGELRAPLPTPAHGSLAAIAGFVVFLIWIGVDQDWAVFSRTPGFAAALPDGRTDWIWGLARLAGFALVVPVMEELFWRSLVLRWIERHEFLSVSPRSVGLRALVITTALFALEHERWFAGVAAGLVYAGVYMRSGSLWTPILAHAITNASLGIWILYTQNWQLW